VGQIRPFAGESILMARRVLVVDDALEDAVGDELLEPVRDDRLLGAAVLHEIREPRASVVRVTNEHQAPSIAGHTQGPCNGARLAADLIQLHLREATRNR
jgi:hypothetical protein